MTEGRTPEETASAIALPAGGVISDDTWEEFASITTGALGHMIDGGETPAFLGQPMTKDDAIAHLSAWLDDHKATLVEGGVDFMRSLVKQLAIGDEPQPSIDEFEAGLVSLTAEQLVVVAEQLGDQYARLRADVIDRRREMVAQALGVGNQLLRGAVASGVQALLARV